eukprot:g5445.t1
MMVAEAESVQGSQRSRTSRDRRTLLWRASLGPCYWKWMPDSATSSCLLCNEDFGWFGSKHHCRECGFIVCASCSPREKEFADGPARVCLTCEKGAQAEQAKKTHKVKLHFTGMTSGSGVIYWVASDYSAADHFPPSDMTGAVASGALSMEGAKETKGAGDGTSSTWSISCETTLPHTVLAISGFHSALGLNAIRTGIFGIPKDGIFASKDGFSNFGPPKFRDCCLVLDKDTTLNLTAKYYLSGGDEELHMLEVVLPLSDAAAAVELGVKYDSLSQGKALVVKQVEAKGLIADWNKAQAAAAGDDAKAKVVQAEDYLMTLDGESVQEWPTKKIVEEVAKRLRTASVEKPISLQFARVVPKVPAM